MSFSRSSGSSICSLTRPRFHRPRPGRQRGQETDGFEARDSGKHLMTRGPEMSINLERLKTERDQAESKMASAVRDANRAKEWFIVDIHAYDEWQAKKNASSAAMAEFRKANAAYLKATRRARSGRDRASDTGQGVAVTKTEPSQRTRPV